MGKGKSGTCGIGYVRQNFWPLRDFLDLHDVNRQAREWLDQIANRRLHSETRERPIDRFQPDALRCLPVITPDYRDTVEALVHKDSRVAVVRLERDSREVRLVLQDQGRGLPEAVQPQGKGFVGFGVGIMGMRERAEQLGGRLELASNDVGTRLSVTLPLVHSNEENACSVGG